MFFGCVVGIASFRVLIRNEIMMGTSFLRKCYCTLGSMETGDLIYIILKANSQLVFERVVWVMSGWGPMGVAPTRFRLMVWLRGNLKCIHQYCVDPIG